MGSIPDGWVRQLDGSYSAPKRVKSSPVESPQIVRGLPVQSPQQGYGKYHVSAASERTVDGIVFDSKLELKAYQLLKERGISFNKQPEYVLQEKFDFNGKHYREIKYVGDFLVHAPDGDLLVDTKGFLTPEFRLKEKLLIFKFKIHLHRVKSVSDLSKLLISKGVSL